MTETVANEDAPTEEQLIAGGKVMSIWDHLSELRSRLVKSFFAILIFFAISFTFAERIIQFLRKPLEKVLPPGVDALHFTGPMDVFMVDLKVGFLVSVVVSGPVWLYQFWKFFEPALYPRERKYILPFVFASSALFFAGIFFCYFVALPIALQFLIKIGMEVGTPIITIKDYISLLSTMILGFAAVFEAPVLLILLAMLDILSAETLVKSRPFVIVGVLIASAILTPPDPISMIVLAVPLYIMYELSILIIRVVKRKQAPKAAA